MLMKIFCTTGIAMLISLMSFAQNGILSGIVKDGQTGELLPGAAVTTKTSLGTATGINGEYTLSLPAGDYHIRFSSLGYTDQIKNVSISAGQTVELNVALKQSSTNLNVVVVSAGKFEQDLGELTMSMEVIKPNLIEDKNTTSMDEVLQQTPGVIIVDNEPQIRSGSGFSFGAGSRVMVLVDDLPMLSGDAGRPSWGFLPVENVEQIEVIKGASSVLYGSAALSGVINVRTAYPKAEPKTKITAFQGVYSDPQTRAGKYWSGTPMKSGVNFLHMRRVGGLSLVVGGSFLGDDGHLGPIHDINGEPAPSNFDPFTVNRYAADSRARINFNLRNQSEAVSGLSYGLNTNWLTGESLNTLLWMNDSLGLYSAFDGAATRTKQVVGSVDPFVEYLTSKGSRHSLKGRWQKLDNNNDNGQGNYSDVYYGEYQYQQNYDSLGIKDFTSTFGLVGILTEGQAELYSGGNDNGINRAQNYAAFLQLDKKFFDRLTVSAGVRYEYFDINSESDARPVFRSGVNYKLGQATFLRASYGQGFRFPTIAEKFIRTSVGTLNIYPSPEIKSESSYNAEIGVKQGFRIGDFKGYADLALFQQEYENFIEFTFGQWSASPSLSNMFGLGFRSLNTGKAKVTGLDATVMGQGNIREVEIQVLAGYTYTNPISTSPDYVYASSPVQQGQPFFFEAFENVTYQNTSSDAKGNVLKYRMQHLVRADVQASYKEWSVGVSARYNSYMQNIDKIFIDLDDPDFFPVIPFGIINWRAKHQGGDHVIDARISYRYKEIHKFAFIANNALNREYAIRPLTIESPRTMVFQYTIEF
jgi:outer membrane cobalamin receptor